MCEVFCLFFFCPSDLVTDLVILCWNRNNDSHAALSFLTNLMWNTFFSDLAPLRGNIKRMGVLFQGLHSAAQRFLLTLHISSFRHACGNVPSGGLAACLVSCCFVVAQCSPVLGFTGECVCANVCSLGWAFIRTSLLNYCVNCNTDMHKLYSHKNLPC